MSRQTHRDDLTKQFLLGELSDEETTALEERFFEDDDLFEELEIAEDELIELYLDNRLDTGERVSFEKRLSGSPGLRQRVIFAKALANRVAVHRQSVAPIPDPIPQLTWSERLFGSRPALRMAFVAVMLIIVLGSVAWLVRKSRLESQRLEAQRNLEQQQKAAQEREREQHAQREPTEPPQPVALPSGTTAEADKIKLALITLTPGSSRGTGLLGNNLIIYPANEQVEFTLLLQNTSYENYAVRFDGLESSTSFSREVRLPASTNQLIIRVPVTMLPTDDYKIKVEGIAADGSRETVEQYSLGVRRK